MVLDVYYRTVNCYPSFINNTQYKSMLSENILKKLKSLKAKKVFVQIPEGLKTRALEISGFLDKEGFETVTCVEPCFGACDLRDSEAKRLGCDALLHIGHTDFGLKTALPVVYEEWQLDFDPV
ncbi:MAG: diphthamide synthesis protein, partial [Candidatus Aenigmarchaeota archaeon]|nr:diphthamide synthesis protein [Candidatus Aenigmarchaeota archaeon]